MSTLWGLCITNNKKVMRFLLSIWRLGYINVIYKLMSGGMSILLLLYKWFLGFRILKKEWRGLSF